MGKGRVPRLDLAPKRRKPLSLWNPLDYFQLWYWGFFFPQALRWYVETFGESNQLCDCKSLLERSLWWKNSPTQRNLLLQSVFTGIIFSLLFAFIFIQLGLLLNIYATLLVSMLSVVCVLVECFNSGVVVEAVLVCFECVWCSIPMGIFVAVSLALEQGINFEVEQVVLYSAFIGSLGYARPNRENKLASNVSKDVSEAITTGALFGLMIGIALKFIFGAEYSVISGITIFAASFISVFRLEVWLTTVLLRKLPKYRSKLFSHITPVQLPGLSQQVSSWLLHDWGKAIANIKELLTYSKQLIPVTQAINNSLAKSNNHLLVVRVSQLADDSQLLTQGILLYASASLSNSLRQKAIDGCFLIPYYSVLSLKSRINADIRLDTPARAAAAGFWYLNVDDPDNAAKAFQHVQHLPHGQEMQSLAECLALAKATEKISNPQLSASLRIPDSPLLRANTWPAISRLRSVVDDAQIINRSYSRPAKSLALNRALGKLTEIVNKAHLIPLAERNLIVSIAKDWREKLLSISSDIGKTTSNQPIQNPYVAGDPVEGNLFIGRGEVIKQLEELWLTSNQLQSVVLYGHRRMGKTSILKNISIRLDNSNIQVVYINLLNLGAVSEGAGEVLITLTDAVSSQLSLNPPNDEDLLSLPYPTFRRFIQTVNQKLKANQGLIIALDEFEKIEELILANKLDADFLGYLRGLLQMSPKIAFAFAGLHTLEEMTEDYFNPLFASVLPIRIGFFTLPETRELLANPAEDFTLDYRPETLDEIYRLTAGQPYLTQLIGFQLVRHYNHQVFEQGTERTPIFTPEDLNTVIHQSDFFTKGRYYFTGVWNQAAQDAPGQQELLKLLAEKEEGRTISSLRRKSTLSEPEISEALKLLTRHDVVAQHEGNWKIIVPLFRQWVLQHQ